jgi:hypothetical protein
METNNKLIAEFLGIQIEEGQERIYINGLGTELIEYTFNTDWNWLMKAVEKCLTKLDTYNVTTNEHYNNIHDSLWSINITEVYNAVVEFIKWYNEQ